MSGKAILLLTVLFQTVGFSVFSAQEKPDSNPGKQTAIPQSHYFQESGVQVDNLVDRVRFKITYSWEKSWEYFRLACSSVPDAVPAKARDADARIRLKTDELVEQGRQAVKDTADRTIKDLSEKGREIGEDIKKTGEDIKTEAGKKFRENTDQMFK